jgi:hypothetical protein
VIVCSNESHEGSVVPGHEPDCECCICEAARSLPEAIVPDDFTIHRHQREPLYVISFRRTDDSHEEDDLVTSVLLDARMMSKIGALMIEYSLTDAADTLTGWGQETAE